MNTTTPRTVKSEYQCKPLRQKQIKKATFQYLRLQDKLEVMKTCGDSALILYEHYLTQSGKPDFTFEDDVVANSIKWSPSKVKKNRLKLTREDYFLQRKGKLHDGARITITYLDRKLIQEHLGKDTTSKVSNSILLPTDTSEPQATFTPKPTMSLFTTFDDSSTPITETSKKE
jgi:hypothetical protein